MGFSSAGILIFRGPRPATPTCVARSSLDKGKPPTLPPARCVNRARGGSREHGKPLVECLRRSVCTEAIDW